MIINDLKFSNVTCKDHTAGLSCLFHEKRLPSLIEKDIEKLMNKLTMLHHHSKKAHYNFRAGPDENLAFPTFLGIVDAFQRISENVHAHHDA